MRTGRPVSDPQPAHLAGNYDQNAQRERLRGDWLLVLRKLQSIGRCWVSRQHQYFQCLRGQESIGFLPHYRVTLAATGLELRPVEHRNLSSAVLDRSL
jgi:hypothetical protein